MDPFSVHHTPPPAPSDRPTNRQASSDVDQLGAEIEEHGQIIDKTSAAPPAVGQSVDRRPGRSVARSGGLDKNVFGCCQNRFGIPCLVGR